MAQRVFTKAREKFGNGTLLSTGTWKMRVIPSVTPTSNKIKAITALTGAASPITATVASTTGYVNGNIVVVWGVTGNTCANGTWIVANLTGTTFDLQTVVGPGETALASTGNGVAVVTTAFVANLGIAGASTDMPTGAGASTDATLASITVTDGIFKATTPVAITTIAQSTGIKAAVFYQSTATDILAFWADGLIQIRVVVAAGAAATTVNIEPIYATIPTGTVIPMSGGVVLTLTAQANAGATALAVSSTSGAIAVGHTGDATMLNANLPATVGSPGNQTFNFNIDAVFGVFTV